MDLKSKQNTNSTMKKSRKPQTESKRHRSQSGRLADRIACFVPIKAQSQRIPNKNFQLVAGKKLYQIMLEKILAAKSAGIFDDVYVDTDSQEIADYCHNNGIFHIEREPFLKSDQANGNNLLESWIKKHPAYDIYVQLHVTAPFLSIESIVGCVNFLLLHREYDSCLTAVKESSWYWFENEPINYEPSELPRSQDAKPVIRESTALYAIRKNAFLETNCRIGNRPYFFMIPTIEAIDLDNPIDLAIARAVAEEISNDDSYRKTGDQPTHIREHSYPDEMVNVGIDFDGVIHKCSKGFYDGTIYDEPVPGTKEALERLSKKYNIIVYTAKAKPDRPLINGKSGQELVWDWLNVNNFAQYVSEVTAEKPRAVFYVDDKAFRFVGWEDMFSKLDDAGILEKQDGRS